MRTFRPTKTMQMTRLCLAVSTVSGMAAFGLGGHTVWADSCTTPSNGPTGPGASTFVYQCDGTYAGDWLNQYYVYDPSIGKQTPLYGPDYAYDCTTNTWSQAEWDYDSASGAYVENRVAASAPPDLPTNCPVPASSPDGSNVVSSATPPTPGSSISPQSPTSNGTTANSTTNSKAQSGNATIADNNNAGNATTGTANTEVDVANLVQSISNALGSNVATFTSNVDGNVNGDLVLDPSTILANAGSDPQTDPSTALSSTSNNAAIDNTINASASTGNATVVGNGTAGDATTGNATAIVNLINMIDTAVAAGKSFIGTVNINGDLNGNILIPQSVIDELLNSNAILADPSNTNTNSTANESITNNITSNAMSGDAAVTNNQSAGNATTGNAATHVTIMNLTGSSIIGKNVLLVFVNVLGQWVGMIVNAPAGATSAEFGGGITSDVPVSSHTVVEADANLSITNNVNVDAHSGNALVANNGTAGNAMSGSAETAVNILNMENSDLSLASWFGILFINVFGIWNGNFGILPAPASVAPASGPSNGSSQESFGQTAQRHHFATFLPGYYPETNSGNNGTSNDGNPTAILGDATVNQPASKFPDTNASSTAANASHDNYALPALGVLIAGVLLGIAERDRLKSHKK